MSEPIFLTLDELLQIHLYQVENHGGSDVVLDMTKLESAIAQPRQGFGGQYLHEDFAAMAAAYLFHLVQNHPFEDGNKRTGAHASVVFMRLNGVTPPFTNQELMDITLAVASGNMTKDALIDVFRRKLNRNDEETG